MMTKARIDSIRRLLADRPSDFVLLREVFEELMEARKRLVVDRLVKMKGADHG